VVQAGPRAALLLRSSVPPGLPGHARPTRCTPTFSGAELAPILPIPQAGTVKHPRMRSGGRPGGTKCRSRLAQDCSSLPTPPIMTTNGQSVHVVVPAAVRPRPESTPEIESAVPDGKITEALAAEEAEALGRLEGTAPPEHSCLPPEVRGTSTIPERERPWVTRRVPQMLAARRISANLTDSLSGAHPTTPDVPSPIEERSR
jgi:hypothetical protein